MSPSNLSFQCAVITGAAGGLGKAIAAYFLSLNKKVILVGRTESKLKEASASLNNAPYYVLDTGKVADIPAFVQKVTQEHPEVDCLVNNAGVQRPLKVQDFDLASADQEIDINIRGPMHLAVEFLEHLKSKPEGALVLNVSSILGLVPSSVINPVYCGTKAWVHFWTMNLRTQLKDTKVRVVEIVPPSVGTDLHRDREDPDDNKKHKNPGALSVEEFMEDFARGMEEGREAVGAGTAIEMVDRWYNAFGEDYDKADKAWK